MLIILILFFHLYKKSGYPTNLITQSEWIKQKKKNRGRINTSHQW